MTDTVCLGIPGKGDPTAAMRQTLSGHPELLGCIYSLTTRSKVGKCCCGSFTNDGPRQWPGSALQQLMARPRTCRSPLPGLQVMSSSPACQDGGLSSRLRVPSRGFFHSNPDSTEGWDRGHAPSRNPIGAKRCRWETVWWQFLAGQTEY